MSLAPAIYTTSVGHVRTTPVRNAFRYRSYHWLVDVDALPALPRWLQMLARFESRDHAGDPGRSLRENVEAFTAAAGIDLAGGQIVMLAHARVLGHVFNPLSVFWCRGSDGRPACVVAEVHNTYGGRHRYLLLPDEAGRASTEKVFYVSPFYPVEGTYDMVLPEPGASLALSITLRRPGEAPFVATLRGERRPATVGNLLRAALHSPMVTLLGALQIRYQGIRLWARRVPVIPRPAVPHTAASPTTVSPTEAGHEELL